MNTLYSAGGSAQDAGLLHGRQALKEKERHSLELERQITELFDAWRTPLYRYALSLGLPSVLADEVVQEAFLRLLQHLRARGGKENLRGWLFRVTHNLAIDAISSTARMVSGGREDEPFSFDTLTCQQLGPEELLLHKERMLRMHTAMQTLSLQQRECVSLRSEGFRYREIAGIMGISVHTVEEHLQRAMAKLVKGVRG